MVKKPQQLRIIGGQWRGRKITFPALAEIRPTPDRVRETLFNWLMPVINGAYCLDLFTGSGALGLEALSRGARHVVMIDKSPVVIEYLRDICQTFQAGNVTLQEAEVPEQVILPPEPFDIIFLDPPFHQKLITMTCAWLEKSPFIKTDTHLYVEMEKQTPVELLPDWKIIKTGKTSQIHYYLMKKNPPALRATPFSKGGERLFKQIPEN